MADNLENTDAGLTKSGRHLLAGTIELTPEAHSILTKQINRRIVWGHKFAKGVLFVLCGIPLLVSLFFGYGFYAAGINSVPVTLVATALIAGPMALTWFLIRWVGKL